MRNGDAEYKTKSLDGTNPKTNPNCNTNPIQLFYAFYHITILQNTRHRFSTFYNRPSFSAWLFCFNAGTLCLQLCCHRTHEDERTVLYKTKSLDGTKPNTNPKTNPNPNPNLTQILTLFSWFMLFSSIVPSSSVYPAVTDRMRSYIVVPKCFRSDSGRSEVSWHPSQYVSLLPPRSFAHHTALISTGSLFR